MKCHLCGDPAVDRCYTCGQLFCDRHGRTDCSACTNGIAAGDPRPDRITAEPGLAPRSTHAWWRPREAEEYQPPACYVCKGLTRSTCHTCGRQFCKEHAGNERLCRSCYRSSSIFLSAFAVLMLLVVGMVVWGLLQ